MLVEYSTSRGFRSEVDMFVAQAVLQYVPRSGRAPAPAAHLAGTPSLRSAGVFWGAPQCLLSHGTS